MPSSLQQALASSREEPSTTLTSEITTNSSWDKVEVDNGVESLSSNDSNNSKMMGEETKTEDPPKKKEEEEPPKKKEEDEKKEDENGQEDEDKEEKEEEEEDEEEKPGEFVFEGRNPKLVKANVSMISGCMDTQTSMDVGGDTTNKFKLADPAGLNSGALTTVLLDTLGEETKKATEEKMTRLSFMQHIRDNLKDKAEVTQIPQFSASTKVDMNEPFELVPSNITGTKRAVLIGINYTPPCEISGLSGCHNDALNIKNFLMEKKGFQEENIVMIMDNGKELKPTKWNILAELNKMVEASQPGDYCFMSYSGHGGWEYDTSGDEADGFDECLFPCSGGQILDDELFENVVTQLKENVTMFALIDACHSGTVLDLPYRFAFKGDEEAVADEREEQLDEMMEEAENEDDDDEDDEDEDKSDLDDQMMAMTAMLLMMQVNRKMGKKKADKLKDKMNKMMEFFG